MKKKVTDLIYMYTIYDESNSYHEFLHYIEPIKQFRNIIIKNGSLYKDVLLFFIKKDKSIIVYLLLYIRQKLKRIR